MRQNSNTTMRSLPMVASVLSRKYGVQVEIGGSTAYTDGNVIHLPGLPVNSDPETLNLVRAYLDHEAAHIRETDFSVLKEESVTPLIKHIWNIFEDWRVENTLAKKYPGCRSNFNWLIEHEFTKPIKVTNKPIEVVNYILYAVRSWDVEAVSVNQEAIGKVVGKLFPGLLYKLNPILDEVRTNCSSSADAMVYAKRIADLIKTESENNLKSKASGSSQSKDQGSSTDGASQPKQEASKQSIVANKLNQLVNASANELPGDFGNKLAEQLADHCSQSGTGLTVSVVGEKKTEAMSNSEIDDVKRSSVALHTRLQSLLQSSVMKRRRPARSGRLNPSRLYRINSDPKLFLRNEQSQGISTSVHILFDCSGSMRSRIQLATQACYSIVDSLSKIKGVSVAVTAFPADHGLSKAAKNDTCPTVYPLLKHGGRVHSNFKLKARGTTPMGEALWWLMQQDMALPENRKIILILTDGRPDCYENTEQAIVHGKELGFEFYGISINDTYIKKMLPDHSRVITQLDELAPVMFELLQNALLHRS